MKSLEEFAQWHHIEVAFGDVLIGMPYKNLVLMGFVEVERAGEMLTHWQEQFQQKMSERGIFYCIAHNVEEVDEALKAFLEGLQN